jgi:N-acetylglutamate synthase-like GNAT family acetyltransferase
MLSQYQKLGVWALFVMTKEHDPVAQSFYQNMGFTKSKGRWLYREL